MRKLRVEEMGRLSAAAYQDADKQPIVVILDNVRSMHNVGAVFRTADAFRIEKVYLCGITPQPPHREIRKTAIGAEENVNWEGRAELLPLLAELKTQGFTLLALEQTEGSTLLTEFEAEDKPYAVILGHEITGVDQAALDEVDQVLEIPQYGTKHSLNLSVAAGIVLFALAGKGKGL